MRKRDDGSFGMNIGVSGCLNGLNHEKLRGERWFEWIEPYLTEGVTGWFQWIEPL